MRSKLIPTPKFTLMLAGLIFLISMIKPVTLSGTKQDVVKEEQSIQSDKLDTSFLADCSKNCVYIKHQFDEMEGSGYYILVTLTTTEREKLITDQDNLIEFWRSKSINILEDLQIDQEVVRAVSNIFTEKTTYSKEGLSKINLLTSSQNYDNIDFQLIQNDLFVYTIILNYYTPL